MSQSLAERFWQKVERHSDSECWPWRGANNGVGYGQIRVGGRRGKQIYAHRLSYEFAKGPIPDDLTIDHLCRTPPCVNPAHLEAVTHGENLRRGDSYWRRKTHCPRGHPYDTFNTYVKPSEGRRRCRQCLRGSYIKHKDATP